MFRYDPVLLSNLLESEVQTRPDNVARCFCLESVGAVPKEVLRAEGLILEREIKVFGLNRPVSADGVLDAASHGIAPIKFLCVRIDKIRPAVPCVTIIDDSRFVIHTDAAASRINQPTVKSDSDASMKSRVKIAAAFTASVSARSARFDAAAIKIHVAEISLRPEHDPMPLPVVTDLHSADNP